MKCLEEKAKNRYISMTAGSMRRSMISTCGSGKAILQLPLDAKCAKEAKIRP